MNKDMLIVRERGGDTNASYENRKAERKEHGQINGFYLLVIKELYWPSALMEILLGMK